VTLDDWIDGVFAACWQAHGGSGLAASLGDILDLDLEVRDGLLTRIVEQRRREAAALRGRRVEG
jgi:hypothetical protein